MTSYTIWLSGGKVLTYVRIPLNGSCHNNKFSAPPDLESRRKVIWWHYFGWPYLKEKPKAELMESKPLRAYNQNNQNDRWVSDPSKLCTKLWVLRLWLQDSSVCRPAFLLGPLKKHGRIDCNSKSPLKWYCYSTPLLIGSCESLKSLTRWPDQRRISIGIRLSRDC